MKQAARVVTKWIYGHIAKPLLFRKSPDDVHAAITNLGKIIQSLPVVRGLLSVWAYRNKSVLSQQICGVTFNNPVGLSAGFDKNVELLPLMKQIGFGFMTGGSITADSNPGNARPWYQRLPQYHSLVVHAGLPSQGVQAVVKNITDTPLSIRQNFPLLLSIAKTNSSKTAAMQAGIDDYIECLSELSTQQLGDIYEINISCPNTCGGEPFTSPDALERLLGAVQKTKVTKPIFLKMPIDLEWHDFKALLDIAVKYNVAGVTIGNLRKSREGLALPEQVINGGLSGDPTKEISTELIKKTYAHCKGKLIIIGVGGVRSAEDAYEKIRAGASLIAMITGLIYEGPQVVGDINRGLVRLLAQDGYATVSDAIGVDAIIKIA